MSENKLYSNGCFNVRIVLWTVAAIVLSIAGIFGNSYCTASASSNKAVPMAVAAPANSSLKTTTPTPTVTSTVTPTPVATATADFKGAKKAIVKAYKSYSTKVDLRKYNLNYSTQYSKIKSMMSQIVTATPYLFYAGTSYSVSRSSTTNLVVSIGMGYSSAYKNSDGSIKINKIKKMRTKLDAAVNTALEQVNSNMTDTEKALILHDYLVANTKYTESKSDVYRLSEVGALIKHKANCQGYSLAYEILMKKCGISAAIVSSSKMSHEWNRIKIDGSWYNVDVTWDDPIDAISSSDQYGLVNHDNFMCSDTAFTKNGHYGYSKKYSTSTTYDDKFWNDVTSQIYYVDGNWIYMTSKGIIEKTSLEAAEKSVTYNITASHFVKFSDDIFYMIAYNNIYIYDLSENTATCLWKTSEHYDTTYTLTQIKYSNDYIYYKATEGTEYKTGKLAVSTDGTLA